jgi:hypothetical protein
MTLHPVSGRYRGRRSGLEIELRIDIDGARATNRVSADFLRVAGAESEYLESMRLDLPKITLGPKLVIITGTAWFSHGIARRRVEITIPLVGSGRAPVTVSRITSDGRRTLLSVCAFESERFRRVELEEASERGIDRPPPFDTASLPSRVQPRTLSTVESYADAGIELASTGELTVVDTSEAGPDRAWSDSELHAAMEQHFSLISDDPRWAIWLMHAADHVNPKLSGLMFDHRGPQRQGCAVFYGREPAATAFLRRARLYNAVHELGHGFNLRHCWQRSLNLPPIESRPDALTWMNYPERHKRGPDAFFEDFGFEFDDPELVHLRHAFRQQVIMGGAPFTGSGARERDGGWASDPQDPALRLRLSAPESVGLHFPVTVGLELSSTARRGRLAPTTLDPRSVTVEIAIRRPNGEELLFEPLLRHCHGSESTTVRHGAGVRDFPFLHYGKNGFAFEEPGVYRLQARYAAPDGLIAVSNFATLRVRAPVSLADRRVADLVAGDHQVGTLLSLGGSRAPGLSRGNAKLQEIILSHPGHPLAGVARVVRATSLARTFKLVDADGNVDIVPARVEEAYALIRPVIDLSAALRAAATVEGEAAQRAAFSNALLRTPTKRGISPLVTTYINGRRDEIASVRRGLARPRPTGPPPARRPPTNTKGTSYDNGQTSKTARPPDLRTAQAGPSEAS